MHMGHGRYGQFEKHVTVPGQSTWSSRSLELATCCSWIAPASDEKTFDVTAKPKRLWLQMSGHQESHIKFVWTLAPFEATASALDSAWVSRLKPWVRTQSTRNIVKLTWDESKAEVGVSKGPKNELHSSNMSSTIDQSTFFSTKDAKRGISLWDCFYWKHCVNHLETDTEDG